MSSKGKPSLSGAGCAGPGGAACLTSCSGTTLVRWRLPAVLGAALPRRLPRLHPAPAQHSNSVSLAPASDATLHQAHSTPASHAKRCNAKQRACAPARPRRFVPQPPKQARQAAAERQCPQRGRSAALRTPRAAHAGPPCREAYTAVSTLVSWQGTLGACMPGPVHRAARITTPKRSPLSAPAAPGPPLGCARGTTGSPASRAGAGRKPPASPIPPAPRRACFSTRSESKWQV